ncbi:MAG: DUF4160 domain-containing protein [Dehalococcoidia bacterium]|nr:DUF4160 domain-containing protein [Dehalococcoidia bacterium]
MYDERGSPHHRPHIHAYYQDAVGVYTVDVVELIAGRIPRRQHRIVQAWINLHQDELITNWELLQSGRLPHRIDPLS